MTAPINNAFYADPAGLAALRGNARAQDPTALKEVARQFESLFTQMLLKSMREATKSTGDGMFDSDQTDFYQGMFDDQMAMHLSQGRGLGLADMLVRQLAGHGQQAAGDGQSEAQGAGIETPLAPSFHTPGQTSSIATPIASSKEDFIRKMWPQAQKAASEIGVDPHALLAQAALETGWGKSVPDNAVGASSFNLFGIKAGGQWAGATVSVPTLEFEGGIPVRKVERFRSYESAADSFRDYARLIRDNPRYEKALNTGTNVAGFAAALQQGGYATDPNYAQKIVTIANEMRDASSPDKLFKVADGRPIVVPDTIATSYIHVGRPIGVPDTIATPYIPVGRPMASGGGA